MITNPKPILHLFLLLCAFPCAAQSPADTTAAAPLDDLYGGWFRRAPQAAVGDFVGQLIVTICADSSGRVLSADVKTEAGLPQPYTKIIKDDFFIENSISDHSILVADLKISTHI